MSPPNGSIATPQLREHFAGLERRGRFGRAQVDRLRHQQRLRLERAGQHLLAQLLVQNPLVQRVLIDHHHAVVALGDQIAVVNLQCRGRRLRAAETIGNGRVDAMFDRQRVGLGFVVR